MATFTSLNGYEVEDTRAREDLNTSVLQINERIDTEVEEINSSIDTKIAEINSTIENVESEINAKSIFVLIGDSYGLGHASESGIGWTSKVKENLGFSDEELYSASGHGAGFSSSCSTTFLNLLQSLNIEEKNHVKQIVVCGGYNEPSDNTVDTGIEEFVNFVKTNYPNAIVKIGMVAHSLNATKNNTIINDTLNRYMNCTLYGANYISNSECILCSYNHFSSDGFHPSDVGQYNLGKYLSNVLFGNIDVIEPNVSFTGSIGESGNCTLNITMNVRNHVKNISCKGQERTWGQLFDLTNGAEFEFCSVNGGYFTSSNEGACVGKANGYMTLQGGTETVPVNYDIFIVDRKIKAKIYWNEAIGTVKRIYKLYVNPFSIICDSLLV